MTLKYVPARAEDAEFAAGVWSEVHPDEPIGRADKRHLWSLQADEFEWRRFLVHDGGLRVGYAMLALPLPQARGEGDAWLEAEFMLSARNFENLVDAVKHLEDVAAADGAHLLRMHAYESDSLMQAVARESAFAKAGVEEVRVLDLQRNAHLLRGLREESRRRMNHEGVRLTTLAELPTEGAVQTLYDCFVEALEDAPHVGHHTPPPLEWYVEYLSSPQVHADRVWVALDDGGVVGESELTFPIERGHVWTSWTGVARRARKRGIALALKLESLVQAAELGVASVRTDNDERNAAMIGINEKLGFRRADSFLRFRKMLQPTP